MAPFSIDGVCLSFLGQNHREQAMAQDCGKIYCGCLAGDGFTSAPLSSSEADSLLQNIGAWPKVVTNASRNRMLEEHLLATRSKYAAGRGNHATAIL